MAALDEPLIAWLGDPEVPDAADARPDVRTVGGKGASLHRLASLGFRVPPGFCLTTTAFRRQLELLRSTATDGGTRDEPGAAIARTALTPEISTALRAAVSRLAAQLHAAGFAPRFAVRSSAVAEDGQATSYAGLHETELDVPIEAIEAAVRRCWASLWSREAAAYRRRRALSEDDAAMAVVVQALVPADASAVVFTCHPVTGREDRVVLTSTRGLGDAMVAGTITPDTTIVDKVSRAVLEFDPGDGSAGGAGPALAADVLDELVAISLAVESRLGLPVDIEAAHAGGAWCLLQARPITAGASTDDRVFA